MEVATIGFDIAKNVFQVRGADERGRPVLRRRLRRGEVLPFFAKLSRCLVGMEACSTAHFWAREIGALGHEVKLIPAKYVKPYIPRGKSDAADAAGICEAVTRPTMRFAAVKSVEQQSVLVLHRVRDLLVKQRTMLANASRGNLGEFGVIGPLGLNKVDRLVDVINDEDDGRVPKGARAALRALVVELEEVRARIGGIEAEILAWHRSNEASVRLATIPGVGPITASAIVATVADASMFRSARHFAAFLGLRRSSTPPARRSGWAGFPSRVTTTSGGCSSSARRRSSATPVAAPPVGGPRACCSDARPWSSRSRSPTSGPGSPGPSWRGVVSIPSRPPERADARDPGRVGQDEDSVTANRPVR